MEDSNRREAVYEAVETRYMGLVGLRRLEPTGQSFNCHFDPLRDSGSVTAAAY